MIRSRQLSFMSACDIGESLIAIDEFGKGIFQIDKADMSSHLLVMLNNMTRKRNLYQCAERFGDEIFFFPYSFVQEEVIVYHLESHEIEYLDLGQMSNLVQGDYKPAQRIENDIWLFPVEVSRSMLIFHIYTREIEEVSQWKKLMQDFKLTYTDAYRKVGWLIEVQNVIYATIKGTNYILKIDKNRCKFERHILPKEVRLHVMMDYDGQNLWMLEQRNRGIIAWNPVTDYVQYYSMELINDELQNDNWTMNILCGKKYLWLIPNWDNRLVRMDYKTGKYEFVDVFPEELCYRARECGGMFYLTTKTENIADIYPFTANMVIHIDLENDRLLEQHEQIFLPREWSEEDILNYQLQNGTEYESQRIISEVYMDYFYRNIDNLKMVDRNGDNGKNIWNRISGE